MSSWKYKNQPLSPKHISSLVGHFFTTVTNYREPLSPHLRTGRYGLRNSVFKRKDSHSLQSKHLIKVILMAIDLGKVRFWMGLLSSSLVIIFSINKERENETFRPFSADKNQFQWLNMVGVCFESLTNNKRIKNLIWFDVNLL